MRMKASVCVHERVREKERKRARAGEMVHLHRHLWPPPHLWYRYGQVPEWVKHGGAEAADCARHGAFQLSYEQVWRKKTAEGRSDFTIMWYSTPAHTVHLPTTLLSSLSKYMFHIRLAFSSSLWVTARECEHVRSSLFSLSNGQINMTRNDNMVVAL